MTPKNLYHFLSAKLITPGTTLLFTAMVAQLVLSACSGPKSWHKTTGVVWGTSYSITYEGPRNLDDSITAILAQVENSLSAFKPSSNISAINRDETDVMTSMTAEVFTEAQRVSKISGGYFDPTVAPLVNLWGFGYRDPLTDGEAPDSAAIEAALERVGIDGCRVDPLTGEVTRKHRHTEFDFSAIAKGYGVDCVARMLSRNGCENYLVEIGGEMAMAGHNPYRQLWRIQIDSPMQTDSVQHAPLRVLQLTDCAMATSGNYRNWRTLSDGTVVSHTISPKTGRPVRSTTLSATVIAPQCITADALATACMAMPLDQARAMIVKQPEISVLLVISHGDSLKQLTFGPVFKN